MPEFTVNTSQHAQFVEITGQVQQVITESGVKEGVCTVFVPHTAARKKSQKKRMSFL
jgi:thiamine phosphate synthase YjbQ (UPF0047 family)